MSIHQQIIDSKKEFQAYQGSSDLDKALQWVEIDYQLADGSIMVRSYDVPAAKIIMKCRFGCFKNLCYVYGSGELSQGESDGEL